MTAPGEWGEAIRFDSDSLGRTQSWTVEWRRLEYTGEVVIVEELRPQDFEPLPDHVSFRIVFTNRGLKPRDRPGDVRTVLAVPRFRYDPVADTDHTLRTLASSAPARPRSAQLQQLLAEQRTIEGESLLGRIVGGYADGRLYTHSGVEFAARKVFRSESPEGCVTALARQLLSLAFSDRPFDETGFPGTLDFEALSRLYAGLFHGDTDAADAVLGFGPGLGLVAADGTVPNDPCCEVHDIILATVESRQGEAPAGDVVGGLVREHGLSRSLATFYLLTFVRQAHAEVTLVDNHAVTTPSGGPFVGDRIAWDLVGEVAFAETLADQLAELRLNPVAAWGAALPYATVLTEALEPAYFDRPREPDEALLTECLGALREDVAQTIGALAGLSDAFPDDAEVHSEALEILGALAQSVDYTEFLVNAREIFGSPAALAEALGTLTQARRLARLVDQITEARTYLDQMTFGRRNADLALERDTLAAQVHPGNLRANPTLWGPIEENVHRLRGRYGRTYASHHDSYHRQARSLRKELEGRVSRVEALALFTEIPGLGPPVGTHVQTAQRDLLAALRECNVEGDVVLDSTPYCEVCRLPLSEEVPTQDAEDLLDSMDAAMRQYNRRLGSRAVQLVLANQSKEQLEQFIKLLQVADPSSLENALDADVIAFLRQFIN